MDTKEKIMLEALKLFSVRGYDSVSVRDIAKAVGIKESSIYNHYQNKQDVFDTILKVYSGRADEFFYQLQLVEDDKQFHVDERTVHMYETMTPEQFEVMAVNIFDYYFTEEINVMLRRMLTIEQYRNEQLAKLFREISFDAAIEFQTILFEALMKAGCFKETDPYVLALEFNAPIFLIFHKFDNDAQSFPQARQLFVRHVRHFNETYKA